MDQNLQDNVHKDLRRARAAAINIVPTTTGAAKALALVIPELKGKFDGFSVRVPTPTVSLVDFVVQLERSASVEAINNAFREAAESEDLEGILGISDEELVSSDFIGTSFSSVIDLPLTMSVGRLSTRRRCSVASLQMISISTRRAAYRFAVSRQPLRLAATGLTQSAITVRPITRFSAASALAIT